MIPLRRAIMLLALAALSTGVARAQRVVTVTGPADNPLLDAIPGFTISAAGFVPSDYPLRFTLQVGTTVGFATGVLVDTTVSSTGNSVTVAPRHLLPEKGTVYWRAVVTTINGMQVLSSVVGPRFTADWLTLLSPNNPNGSTVTTRRPVFTWSSARIHPSVGRWQYELRIIAAHGTQVHRLDTTWFMPPVDGELEGNTSYRWVVTAWTPAGDTARVQSAASFVVLDSTIPPATILFQNFPNPFPNSRVPDTCIWFDLRTDSRVDLQVLDLHGNRVRGLIPGADFPAPATFPAGRHGRANEGSNSGCDPRFRWDGRDDTGRYAPPGVYLIRLRADGVEMFRKALFRGR